MRSYIVFICLVVLLSCNNDDNRNDAWKIDIPIKYELPSIMLNVKEYENDKSILINSQQQLRDELCDSILNKYPQFTSVDFSKHSILVNYTELPLCVKSKKLIYI